MNFKPLKNEKDYKNSRNIYERFVVDISRDGDMCKVKVEDRWIEKLFCHEGGDSYILNVREKFCLDKDVDKIINQLKDELRKIGKFKVEKL